MREWTILGYNIMNHLRYVHTVPERFCVAVKTIPDKASVHTQERLWRRDFCDGAKPISKAESHTRLVFVALRKASGGSREGALRPAPLLIFRPN